MSFAITGAPYLGIVDDHATSWAYVPALRRDVAAAVFLELRLDVGKLPRQAKGAAPKRGGKNMFVIWVGKAECHRMVGQSVSDKCLLDFVKKFL